MTNELIFFISIIFFCSSSLLALYLGKHALIALICLQAVLVNLFVTKQIQLFGFCATASDTLAIGTSLALNLLQEYWGKPIARSAIFLSFSAAIFYTIASQLHLWYIPHPIDTSHAHFYALLMPLPRIIAASLITYLFIQWIDYRIYARLKVAYQSKQFVFRNLISLCFTQLLDTVLFSILGLYGTIIPSYTALRDIIIVSYILKMIIIVSAVPAIGIVRRYIQPTQPGPFI